MKNSASAGFTATSGNDEEVASPSSSSSSSSSSSPSSFTTTNIASPRRFRYGYAAALSSILLAFVAASIHSKEGPFMQIVRTEDGPSSSPQPESANVHDISSSYSNSIPEHFVEAPRSPTLDDITAFPHPLPVGPADISHWSPFPASSIEDHTLGYPFVAACTNVNTDEKRSLALAMSGAFDILDAFRNNDDGDDIKVEESLFGGPIIKTTNESWTYTFVIHDADDLAQFLSYGLDYVPDIPMTRDLQDSRIGISHEEDEDGDLMMHSPGNRRRLAKPTCNDGTCRLTCDSCCPGGLCETYESDCSVTCPGAPGPSPPPYQGVGECSVVTPINYNALFTPGLTGTYDGITNYGCYRTVLGTNNTADDLVATYPNLTEKIMLNQYPTVENGYYLYVLKLTDINFDPAAVNPSYGEKGKVLATCSIHSREFTPAETCTRFAEYLLQNYDTDPDIQWILKWNEIHLILHANPDGRKYDEDAKDLWRKNRNLAGSPGCSSTQDYGIDLNRNQPFKWNQCEESGCSSGTCSSQTYRGTSLASEQETQSIVEYAKTVFPAEQRHGPNGSLAEAEVQGDLNNAHDETNMGVFMDVHSYGGDVGWAWGYKNLRSGNDPGMGALGRKLASYNEYTLWAPEMPSFSYPVDGDTCDTMYGWFGEAGLFWELGTQFYQSCSYYPTIVNQVFPGFLYAAKVAKSPFITSKGPDVLCMTLSAPGALSGETIDAAVDVSDSVRAEHADDRGTLFATGGQNIDRVELYVNCHPNEGCSPDVVNTITDPATTATAVLTFIAPVTEGDHTIYVRAVDSDGYAGPVTARSFITCPATGCPFTKTPTSAPTNTPPPPACNNNGICEVGENCNNCPNDCDGRSGGKPADRFCCGNGVQESAEGDGTICDGNQ